MTGQKNNIIALIGIGFIAILISFFNYKNKRRIIAISKAFIGQQEISGNRGFQNEEMERLMKEVGWKPGDAWCVYFVKLIWHLQAPDWLKPKIKSAISGSSQQTWQNVTQDSAFLISKIPKPGDMVIWQNYKNGAGLNTGHAGVVTKVNVNNFHTIEGNTNLSVSNDGIEVAEKVREYNFTNNNGLRLKGFVRFA